MSDFKQIIGYMDQLHQDIGQLVALIESQVQENGFTSLEKSGNRITWGISGHMSRYKMWRIPNLSRLYVSQEEEEQIEHTIFYFISLHTNTEFEFPTIVCGHIHHPPLTQDAIYNQIYREGTYLSLMQADPQWKQLEKAKGWVTAVPTANMPITQLQCYILNLFDLSDRQLVMDNIITPLTQDPILPLTLTIPSYAPRTAIR
ncbi:MAG: hypothetical protein KC421_13470 [Anaerolineales bacterium]|nr:hypothetical protein [Anaerolineales bacterium]